MSDLFSHADPEQSRSVANSGRGLPDEGAAGTQPPEATTAVVVVRADLHKAWEGFTEYLHLWWPSRLTHFGTGTHAEITDNHVGEENAEGEHYEWARIVEMDPQRSIELHWTLGAETSAPSRVRISFERNQEGTKVTAVHDGWAAGAEGAEQVKGFDGWPEALTAYAHFMGSTRSGEKS